MQDFWNNFDWAGMVQKIVIAILILIITWILARVVKWALAKLVGRIGLLRREGADGRSVGESLGQIGALLVWLFGLVAILQVFALSTVLEPVQSLLGTIMGYLPNIIGAGVVFFIGCIIAKIAKQLTETALSTVDWGKLGRKLSPNQAAGAVGAGGTHQAAAADQGTPPAGRTDAGTGGPSPSTVISVLGNLVFAIILIVVAIAALQILGISAISDPAEQMLQTILDAIPAIIAAALILGLGYLIAKFVGGLLESTLRGLGTDRAVANMGITSEGTSASTILTRIAQVAILLFFGIMAARMLNFPEITEILNEVLELGGRVLFGAAIIAAGFLIANILAKVIGPGTVSTIIRYTTIVLFIAMGLQYMGIADSIINLAFGALVVGVAAAAVLAYGLGGRDAAARSLQKLERKVDSPSGPGHTPPTGTPPGNPPTV